MDGGRSVHIQHHCRMLKKARLLTRQTLARRDAPCPSKAATSEEGESYCVPYVEPLSEVRTLLADCFSILLSDRCLVEEECLGQLPGRLNS